MIPRRGHYRLVYADPAWDYVTYSERGRGKTAHRHYSCMPYEQLAALPVGEWAAEDSVLLMWVADPFLEQALRLGAAWGFAYKTVGFYWVKTLQSGQGYFEELVPPDRYHFGQGYWTHGNPEQCLLFTRGSPYQYVRSRAVAKLVVAPVREHSRKPEEIRDRIEHLISGPYLEMFARQRRPGWASWGNEVGKF